MIRELHEITDLGILGEFFPQIHKFKDAPSKNLRGHHRDLRHSETGAVLKLLNGFFVDELYDLYVDEWLGEILEIIGYEVPIIRACELLDEFLDYQDSRVKCIKELNSKDLVKLFPCNFPKELLSSSLHELSDFVWSKLTKEQRKELVRRYLLWFYGKGTFGGFFPAGEVRSGKELLRLKGSLNSTIKKKGLDKVVAWLAGTN